MTQSRFNAFPLSPVVSGHRGPGTLAALGFALVLTGCGGGGNKSTGGRAEVSKSVYEQRIQQDGQGIKNVFTPLSRPPSSLAQLASEIKTGQNKLREAADDLDGVTPPKDIAHDNDALVAGLRKLADQLEPLRKGAARGDAKLVQKAVGDLQASTALKDAQQATNDMKKRGYKIGTLGE
jgi:hypothetical protein